MFDRIAPRYDLLNRVLSAGIDVRWRRRCIDAAGPASRVLDVCSGTGDLLIEFLRRDPARRGLGVDLSTGCSCAARPSCDARGWRTAGTWRRETPSGCRSRPRSVDAVTVAFGIRNVGEPLAALREMLRVLRPGGRAVILEFSMPQGTLGVAYRLYFTHVLPRIGGLDQRRRGSVRLPARLGGALRAAGRVRRADERGGFRGACRGSSLTAGVAHLYIGEKERMTTPLALALQKAAAQLKPHRDRLVEAWARELAEVAPRIAPDIRA